MNVIRQSAVSLASWPGWPLSLLACGATPAFAVPPPPEPSEPGHVAGRDPHHRLQGYARLADHPYRRRGCPARGHGGGTGRPGTSQPPESNHCGRLNHVEELVPPARASVSGGATCGDGHQVDILT